VTYARCPKQFYWSEVDRLPRRYSPAARRGVDVHRRIELHHRGVIPLDDALPDTYDLPEEATGSAGDARSAFGVFTGSRFADARPFLVEAPFELRLGDDVTVRGRIDAVYRTDDDHWEVVDFKSGRSGPPSPSARVQLEAYALAVARVGFAPEPPASVTVTFAYLGGELVEVSEVADESWVGEAETHLTALAHGIEASSFPPTPSAACHRCDFLRFCPAGKEFVRGR
jgi:DNA helicase-2/ATP-dependent DNA helicase PcrA